MSGFTLSVTFMTVTQYASLYRTILDNLVSHLNRMFLDCLEETPHGKDPDLEIKPRIFLL